MTNTTHKYDTIIGMIRHAHAILWAALRLERMQDAAIDVEEDVMKSANTIIDEMMGRAYARLTTVIEEAYDEGDGARAILLLLLADALDDTMHETISEERWDLAEADCAFAQTPITPIGI